MRLGRCSVPYHRHDPMPSYPLLRSIRRGCVATGSGCRPPMSNGATCPSGPISPITGAGTRSTGSASGCARVPGARSSRRVGARVAPRSRSDVRAAEGPSAHHAHRDRPKSSRATRGVGRSGRSCGARGTAGSRPARLGGRQGGGRFRGPASRLTTGPPRVRRATAGMGRSGSGRGGAGVAACGGGLEC